MQEQQSASMARQQAVLQTLQALRAEAEGDGEWEEDADALNLLEQLTALLSSSSGTGNTGSIEYAAAAAAAAALESPGQQGQQLLLFYLSDAACQQAAAGALRAAGQAAAAGSAAVLWPAGVWQRLEAMATAVSGGESSSTAVVAMQLLGWAAGQDGWVRQQLLLHPLPAPNGATPAVGTSSPVAQVVAQLATRSQLQAMQPAAIVAAAQLLQQYAADAASSKGLLALGCRPLLALVRAAAAAEGLDAFAPADASTGLSSEPAAGQAAAVASSREGAEQQALHELRQKRQQVFNAGLVAVRRALLTAAADLEGSSQELLLAEAVERKGSGEGGGGKTTVTAGAFLTGVLQCGARLTRGNMGLDPALIASKTPNFPFFPCCSSCACTSSINH
jgi:hypothetical protein